MNGEIMNPTLLERLAAALEKKQLLTDWESGFVESLHQQFNKRGHLSARQIEVLERIENTTLSDSAIEKRNNWYDNYSDEHRRIARVCAEYYEVAGYFAGLVRAILHEKDFIPTEKAYKRMCDNKYAKKVIAEHDAEPKYIVGSLVSFRSTANWNHKQASKGLPCIVISSGGTIKSAAKGSKPYKVLPFGSAVAVDCEERHLKKCKNPKKAKKTLDNDVPF
jgi:hypothetical protein